MVCLCFNRRGKGTVGFKAPKSALAKDILAHPEARRAMQVAMNSRTAENPNPSFSFTDAQGRQRTYRVTTRHTEITI